MTPRRLLIIGSQCKALNLLDFLPAVATRLHELLSEPGPGGCVGVSLDGHPPGLLLDPTVQQTKAAIKSAINEAADARATLVLAYVGHGEFDERSRDFYLMPTDATETTSDGAIQFALFLNDRLKLRRDHAGLVVLLDACQAGEGSWQAMERWAQSLRGNIGFELLTATDDRDTANAPLTRAVIEILERGDPEVPERIHCRDVHGRLKRQNLPAQHVAFGANDDRLHLGRNGARDPGNVFWKDNPTRDQVLKQTEYFQPTPDLALLVEASRSHPVVVMTGETGAGKSTVAAAMARPELTGGLVPVGFVHAVVFGLGLSTNERVLAVDLERQLRRSVPGFTEAAELFASDPERRKIASLRERVLGPLELLAGRAEVRIVVDAYDQLRDVTRSAVLDALQASPGHLRWIITARSDTPDGPPGHPVSLDRADRDVLDRYLKARRVSDPARASIFAKAHDHWLITRLLADAVLADPGLEPARLPETVNDAYAKLLDQADAADSWGDQYRPLLGPLAVAGAGPVLPLRLLAHASEAQGGVAGEEAVRAVLARLRGLVVRRDAGTSLEHVGLFHPTLVDYLLGASASSAGYAIDPPAAHRALVEAIEALAPMASHDRYDPLHRYALLREPDHFWALDEVERTIECLKARESNDPRENLER